METTYSVTETVFCGGPERVCTALTTQEGALEEVKKVIGVRAEGHADCENEKAAAESSFREWCKGAESKWVFNSENWDFFYEVCVNRSAK